MISEASRHFDNPTPSRWLPREITKETVSAEGDVNSGARMMPGRLKAGMGKADGLKGSLIIIDWNIWAETINQITASEGETVAWLTNAVFQSHIFKKGHQNQAFPTALIGSFRHREPPER